MNDLVRAGLLATTILAGSCARPSDQPPPAWDFVEGEPSEWVMIFDPQRAWNGYTLALYRGRIPMLFDMNGRIVHAWPQARVRSRVRLLPDGHLLAISLAKGVVEYDWEGSEVWRFQPSRGFVHHDVVRLANGNTVMLVHGRKGLDEVLEVDRAGEIVWRWSGRTFLKRFLTRGARGRDPLHLNSVQELPENRWFDGGDERFRPGNLLLSARNLDRILIADRASGEVAWSWSERLDRQHEALMIPKGQPGDGKIQVFNNRYASYRGDRRSEVLEVQPVSGEVTWSFTDETFYSPTSALAQPLPNGNMLIASSRGSRVFEVTRDGAIVWQWTPPFQPRRPGRYAADHCPQLARLGRRATRPVTPSVGYRYVDRDVYRLARRPDLRKARVFGRPMRRLMAENDYCGKALIPGRATLLVEYGVDRQRTRQAKLGDAAVRFALTWAAEGEEPESLFEDTIGRDRPWRSQRFDMDRWALHHGALCLETSALGAPEVDTESFAFWIVPTLISEQASTARWARAPEALTEEELEVRRRHLEALGYAD